MQSHGWRHASTTPNNVRQTRSNLHFRREHPETTRHGLVPHPPHMGPAPSATLTDGGCSPSCLTRPHMALGHTVQVPAALPQCPSGLGVSQGVHRALCLRCAHAMKSRLFGSVSPDGQGDRDTDRVPRNRAARMLTQSKHSENELKQTIFPTKNARLLFKSAVLPPGLLSISLGQLIFHGGLLQPTEHSSGPRRVPLGHRGFL